MKFLAVMLLFTSLAVAQNKQVQVTDTEKKDIELSQLKLQNFQLQANAVQTQAQKQLTDLQDQYNTEKAHYDDLLSKARKAHGVDANATWDGQKFSFDVPKEEPKKP